MADPLTPQDDNKKPDVGVDLSKILLPKKPDAPGMSLSSASRVNAGALLEQEQTASLPTPVKPVAPVPPAPQKPKEETVVKPIETYQSDIEKLVQGKNMSVVSIAAAEAGRRGGASLEAQKDSQEKNSYLTKTMIIAGGVALLVGATTLILFALRPAPSVNVYVGEPPPFIHVDNVRAFTVPVNLLEHNPLMNALETQRMNVSLSLGLIEQIFLALPSTSTVTKPEQVGARQLLKLLGPHIDDALVRAISDDTYLLGIHSYDSNQAFLILQTSSYEQTFSGVLRWERWMSQDLAPLFTRTPQVKITEEVVASSSPTSTPVFVQTGFSDRVVENHDARVMVSDTKDILLLWTFVNRNTLVITTNEATLREILSRIKNTPVVPLP